MVCQRSSDPLVQTVSKLYNKISKLESLKPCKDVDLLLTELVLTCVPPNPIDLTKLECKKIQEMRSNLIKICGEAEGYLETHYSTILSNSFDNPLHNLNIFPYFTNYLKLSLLEFEILSKFHNNLSNIRNLAFVGSGPLPLTSIVLASNYLTNTTFHNYDIDPHANSLASKLVAPDHDLCKRMFFYTSDIMDVTNPLKDYDVVFLAALVGMDREMKSKVIDHLAKYMSPGAILMVRSAHGARAFLYPVVDNSDLHGFEVLSVFHPTDEVINSVIIARKPFDIISRATNNNFYYYCDDQEHKHQHLQGLGNGNGNGNIIQLSCKCAEMQAFNNMNQINHQIAADQE